MAGLGRVDTINLLLEKGADVNAKNNYGDTALYLAKTEDNKRLLRIAEAK